ncbi:MAG: type II toxin-antitoxin system MqsA family antitoxin [Anaerolineae bacterium]|nr:type II toxin-antitoxin system MqsA family antitoxin [Anaerolineae bacterium]
MSAENLICPICHYGKLCERLITHSQIFEGQLIVTPKVPALVCDVCGEKILDDEVLTRLSGLLGQSKHGARSATQRHSWP